MKATALTPALVRRYVAAGQIYAAGPRRFVRILRVWTDPPSVTARRCTRDGEPITGRHRSGPLAGSKHHPFTIYLTWRDGRWCLPAAYTHEE